MNDVTQDFGACFEHWRIQGFGIEKANIEEDATFLVRHRGSD